MASKVILASLVFSCLTTSVVGQLLDAKYRLLFTGVPKQSGGLVVSTVDQDGPSQKLFSRNGRYFGAMEPGDVVVAVNGVSIRSEQDYLNQLASSGGNTVDVAVRDVNDGAIYEWTVTPSIVRRPRLNEERVVGKVQVLIFGRSDEPDIGSTVRINIEQVSSLLSSIPATTPHKVTYIDGAAATAANVLRSINQCNVDSSDTLFCYGNSHGAYDDHFAGGDVSRGHFLQLHDGPLRRRDLLAALTAKSARLTVLITESCNHSVRAIPGDSEKRPSSTRPNNRMLHDLFFKFGGVVDLNSSRRNSYAFASSDVGGWFTHALLSESNANRDMAVDWTSFLGRVTEQTSKEFQLRYSPLIGLPQQSDQRPVLFINTTRRVK